MLPVQVLAAAFPGQGSACLQEDQRSRMHSVMTLGLHHWTGPGQGTCTWSAPGFSSLHFKLSLCPPPTGNLTPDKTTSPLHPGESCTHRALPTMPGHFLPPRWGWARVLSSLTCCHGTPCCGLPPGPLQTPPSLLITLAYVWGHLPGLPPSPFLSTDILPTPPRRPCWCLSLQTIPRWPLPGQSPPSAHSPAAHSHLPLDTSLPRGWSETKHRTPSPGPAAVSRTCPPTSRPSADLAGTGLNHCPNLTTLASPHYFLHPLLPVARASSLVT